MQTQVAAKVTPKIINFSGHQLNCNEISILRKNTKFCPIPISFNTMVEKNDVSIFCGKLKLAEFFYDCSDSNNDESFVKPKSFFSPPSGRLDSLDATMMTLKGMPTPAIKTVKKYNVTLSERQAIESLSNNKNLVIKEADKGVAVAVINADFYFRKVKEITITASNSYQSLPTNIDNRW